MLAESSRFLFLKLSAASQRHEAADVFPLLQLLMIPL
jgi:hypothetical protein